MDTPTDQATSKLCISPWDPTILPEHTALWVARQQPLHIGHLDALHQVFANGIQKILIGIGSANKMRTDDNPFSAAERIAILEATLKAEGLYDKVGIYLLMDTHNNTRRRQQITDELPPFGTVVTNNEYLQKLFSDKQCFIPLIRHNINATMIRQALLLKENEVLARYLHPSTFNYLQAINAAEIMSTIMGTELIKPKVAVDLVITNRENQIYMIHRKHPPLGLALPGGMVNYGESVLTAALREWIEETGGKYTADDIQINEANKTATRGGLQITITQSLGYRDDPARDSRRHTISFPFAAHLVQGELLAADDAHRGKWYTSEEILAFPQEQFAFPDHQTIVRSALTV